DHVGEYHRQRRRRDRRRPRPQRRAPAAHVVGRDRLDARRVPDRRRVAGRVLHDRRGLLRLHAEPPVRAHARRADDRRREGARRVRPRAKDTGTNRDSVDWRGYFAAVPTPFNEDGSLAPDLLRELLEFYIDQGLHGVLVNGTTGEWFSQSADERKQTAETAIDAVAGRIPIIIGCT